jgi:hypothetical protein
MFIKVNVSPSCRIAVTTGDVKMQKAKTGRGFWSWILGEGWGGGSNG